MCRRFPVSDVSMYGTKKVPAIGSRFFVLGIPTLHPRVAKFERPNPRSKLLEAWVTHIRIASVAMNGEVRQACGSQMPWVGEVVSEGMLPHIPAAVHVPAL